MVCLLTVAVWLSEVNYIYWSTLSQNMWDEICVFSWLKIAKHGKKCVFCFMTKKMPIKLLLKILHLVSDH